MSRAIVPIADLTRRIPEAGRIRTGKKQGNRPTAIGEFRFTSHDRTALDQIAALYGGTVNAWSDPKAADGQYEVITDAPEIRVVLPPDPLGGTPIYEMWGGGGCERRCDGVTCQRWQTGPDGPEQVDVGCICAERDEMACKPITRLCVILPEVRFAGVWRLDTKSWNAAQELPGMVDMIRRLQESGLPYATLSLKHRRSVVAGKTSKFLVPVLGVASSIEELAAGSANVGSLSAGGPDAPALGDGATAPTERPAERPTAPVQATADPDDEIIDAEIVDEAPTAGPVDLAAAVARSTDVTQARALKRAREIAADKGLPLPTGLDEVIGAVLDALVADLGLTVPTGDPRTGKMFAECRDTWPDLSREEVEHRRKGLIAFVADGATSSKDLDEAGWRDLFDSLELIKVGSHEMTLSSDNRWTLQPRRATPTAAARKSGPAHRVQA